MTQASASFNLVTRPWIPVVDREGKVDQIGLQELLTRAHELADLALPVPPAAAVLWRILYAITARVTGLDDPAAEATPWVGQRNDLLNDERLDPDRVQEYFDQWKHRFDLFHPERPWMQEPRLASECKQRAGVNKLVFSWPVGRNHVWFDHHHDQAPTPIPAAQGAWHLLAQLGYGAAGRCSSRRAGTVEAANSVAGPLRATLSFYPLGPTVFQSLVAGMVYPAPHCPDGPPVPDLCWWEHDDLPDPAGAVPQPSGLLSLLTGRHQHAVLLVPDETGELVEDAYLTWAWRQKLPPVEDPYLIRQYVQRSGAAGEWRNRLADQHRALWRDLDALLVEQEDDGAKTTRPAVIEQTLPIPLGVQKLLRVRAIGFDQEGQTKDRQWFTEVTPPVLRWLYELDPSAAGRVTAARQAAEAAHRRLRWALRNAWNALTNPNSTTAPRPAGNRDCPWTAAADVRYWPRAGHRFWLLMDDRDRDPGKEFSGLAAAVYEEVTDHATARPRGAKAVHDARRMLFPARRPKDVTT